MKRLLSKQLLLLSFLSFFMFSCGDDENPEPVVLTPKLEGMYVFGSNTIAAEAIDPKARMVQAVLNPNKSGGKQNQEDIYGQLMYIGANSTIKFTQVENEVGTTYGAAGGGTVGAGVDAGHTDIQDEFIYGTLVKDGPAINVEEEGLYYVFVNAIDKSFRMMKVRANMIGDATPGNWGTSTPLPMVFASKDSTIFEATVNLIGAAGYKYRFNEGYEAFNDGNIATLTFLGVESYGTAWDTGINNLIYKDENIPNKVGGKFTVRLKYDATNNTWKETKTKDYSTTSMGLFGNAYTLPSGAEGNWGSGTDGYGLHTPTKSGNVWTWTWNDVTLIEGREFIFLENGTWGGLQIDYTGATIAGAAITAGQIKDATTVGNEYHNFYVATGGVYNITLSIDTKTDARTITVVKK